VHEALQSIISASKKLMKAETKVIIEELTKKIEEERAKQVSFEQLFTKFTVIPSL
jgi:hypothetical protein